VQPLLPSKVHTDLTALSDELLALSRELTSGIHPKTAQAISESILLVQSYYTNSMEGNPTRLADIEKALAQNFSSNLVARNHQKEHLAHIETQKKMMEWIDADPNLNICSPQFLSQLHTEFYRQLPPEMHFALTLNNEKIPVVPGEWRDRAVQIGAHHSAPQTAAEIERALEEFGNTLNPKKLNTHQCLLALASSHHRFLWIHPFSDGNGRVARLLTQAYSKKIGLDPHQLVSIARGFARNRPQYDEMLSLADRSRRNDWDGRGSLSEEDLVRFCSYFLGDICLDQFKFMRDLTQADHIRNHLEFFLFRSVKEKKISKNVQKLVLEVFLRGSVQRGEVIDIARVKMRQSSKIIAAGLQSGLLKSKSAYGELTLKITGDFRKSLFPDIV